MTRSSWTEKAKLRRLMDGERTLRECGMKLEIKDEEVFVLVSHPAIIDIMITTFDWPKVTTDIFTTLKKFFPKARKRGKRAVLIGNPLSKRYQHEVDSVRANG